MYVIGTAGHVDHGKSTLIQALTGVHPDRLKEEREREMTIDLGFAWLELPNGEEVGIIDVPGHRDFIGNMLAGVAGIDAALLVVAADEGIMPQTREHLAILNLLQIKCGVVVLNKIDLVDEEWLELVQQDLRLFLTGTVLEKAQIVPVSALTRQGLPELLAALMDVLSLQPHRPNLGRPRLPIDRVFTIAGFGTVVTGTLSDGELHIGDEVEVLPTRSEGRIRGLQTHKQKEIIAIPGSRTAVNIAGVSVSQINRGDVVVHPGSYEPTRIIDVFFTLLPEVSQPIKHDTRVKFFIGASETIARIRLLGSDEILPGESGWLQIEMNQSIIATRGDRYILRRPSPGETLGGGSVIDPHPKGRHKRFEKSVISQLEAYSRGSPAEILLQTSQANGPAPIKDLITRSNLELETAHEALSELHAAGELVILEASPEPNSYDDVAIIQHINDVNAFVLTKTLWEKIKGWAIAEVSGYHATYPLRAGIPREELKSRLKKFTGLNSKVINSLFNHILLSHILEETRMLIRIPGFVIRMTPSQEQKANGLLIRFASNPYSPPSVKDCTTELGEDLYQALIDTGKLIEVSSDVVFRVEDYSQMVTEIRQLIGQNGAITAAEVRDHFNTSRKYSLALLEYLDTIGLTIRDGDIRRLQRQKDG
jgi:selenocysteine-specific elongation factor